MKYLLLTLITSFLISCSGGDKTDRQAMKWKINDSWIVVGIQEEIVPADTIGLAPPRMEFNLVEMRYFGNDGCNNFNGGIDELDEKTIRFGIAAGTRMMCPDMKIPDLFNRTLPGVVTWKVKKEMLHLYDAEGNELMQLKRSSQLHFQ